MTADKRVHMHACVCGSRSKQSGWLGFGPTNFHLLIVQSSSVIKGGGTIPETVKKTSDDFD